MEFVVMFALASAIISILALATFMVRARLRRAGVRQNYPEDASWRYAVNLLLVAFFILFTISGVIAGGSVLLPTS